MTIALEHLADGSIVDRNFQKLMRLVPDTGGQTVSIRFGVDSVDFPVSTDSTVKSILHGLGRVPLAVFVVGGDFTGSWPGMASYVTDALTSTTFDVAGQSSGGGPRTNAIYWLAIG